MKKLVLKYEQDPMKCRMGEERKVKKDENLQLQETMKQHCSSSRPSPEEAWCTTIGNFLHK